MLTVQPTVVLLATIETLWEEAALPQCGASERPAVASAPEADERLPALLTSREREIIEAVGQGLSNKGIGAVLGISPFTVRHHLTNIFDKLGVNSRQELLLHSHHHGFFLSKVPR